VRSKNNRFSEAGYEYSILCNLKEKSWAIPISITRVNSQNNKYVIDVQQVIDAHFCGDVDSMIISIADAAYSNTGYLEPLYKKDNIINITRDRKNRAIYTMFTGEQKNKGRKRHYGDKINLSEYKDKLTPDNLVRFNHTSKKGKETEVFISEYHNLLVKGRKKQSMKNNPVNYVKVEMYDLKGSRVYKNDLWLCVSGKKDIY
jgi:hypothetical protein